MPIIYNDKAIIPAPFVDLTKSFDTSEDGAIIGSTFAITLKGTLMADRGSPTSSGTFWGPSGYPPDESIVQEKQMASLLRKQEALRGLFSDEGKMLQIQPLDSGLPPMRCNPRVKRLEFPAGGQGRTSWAQKMDYTVLLEADIMYVSGTWFSEDSGNSCAQYKVSKAAESWAMESLDEKVYTYRLTHSLSATGKRHYDASGVLVKPAWENARDYVLNKIGLGINSARMIASGVINGNGFSGYNHLRTQHVGELDGTFQVTENWVCYEPNGEPPAINDRTVNVKYAENGRKTVSIEGTVTGLNVRDPVTFVQTSTRYENASSKWTNYVNPGLFAAATSLSGATLNTTLLNASVGINDKAGVITYHYEWDDRSNSEISGAMSEIVTVNNHGATDIYASIPVLGRSAGPVLQDIGSQSAKKRTVQIEVVMPCKSQTYTPTEPNTDSMVLALKPVASGVFLDQDDQSWTVNNGRYSRTATWTYSD